MYKKRLITKRLKKLVKVFPIVVLTGARQVGKSTILQKIFPDYDYVVFDPVIDVENARQDPELFLSNHNQKIILDEIQYAPEIVPVLKRLVDKNKKAGQYIITGSHQWGILKSITESLAGRAVFLELQAFCLSEILEQTNKRTWLNFYLENDKNFSVAKLKKMPTKNTLYEQLWRGFLPDSQKIPLENIPDFLGAYIQTYIERDVRLMADISDIQQFGYFIRLSTALSSQEINYSKTGKEIGVLPQTAKRWLDMMTYTFQWFTLPAFFGNALKRLSKKPKGYFFDTGIICYAQVITSPKAIASHPLRGALFESAVVSEIYKQIKASSFSPKMYHWRSSGGAEVDLIIEKDGAYFPIEIKMNSRPSKKDARGIKAFRETYPHLNINSGIIVAPAESPYQITENDYVIPWDTVLVRGF